MPSSSQLGKECSDKQTILSLFFSAPGEAFFYFFQVAAWKRAPVSTSFSLFFCLLLVIAVSRRLIEGVTGISRQSELEE